MLSIGNHLVEAQTDETDKDYTKWELPKAAKARLGKGGINALQYQVPEDMPDVFLDTVVYTLASFFSRDVQLAKSIVDTPLGNPKVRSTFQLGVVRKISDMLPKGFVVEAMRSPGTRLFTTQRVFGS